MVSIKTRCKSAVLATLMMNSGFATATYANPLPEVTAFLQEHKKAIASSALILGVLRVWMIANGTKTTYKLDDWRDDLDALLNSYNIFSADSRTTIKNLVGKWFAGRKLKKVDYTKKTKHEDGSIHFVKDSKIESTPFGLMGLLDAYVFGQLKDLNEYLLACALFCVLFSDPAYAVEKAVNK